MTNPNNSLFTVRSGNILNSVRLNLDDLRILEPLKLLTMSNKLVRSMQRVKHEYNVICRMASNILLT